MTKDTKIVARPGLNGRPVEDWLRALAANKVPSKAVHHVLDAVITNPELASYASTSEMAGASGVNVATVTRSAQSFGFSGWPEWRQEIRARYLGLLSAPELAVVHEASSTQAPFDATIGKHIEHLAAMKRAIDRSVILDFAKAISSAKRRLIVASGSFAAVGRTLAHHAGVAGYRCEVLDDTVVLTNALADLTDRDVLIPITFWRLYNSSIAAAREAKRRGAPVYLISDQLVSPIAELADRILVVPSEGASFFPSIVPSLSIVESVCAQLVKLDPERSAKAIAAAEKQWQEFDLLHFNSPKFQP
ncbi:MurR/RpiR family transcriptional regulator [Bradyrhizobium rifense]|uniref:MurR/RpiR family transcriptional regulator n=1 Tax=Bradyrhizobium rifense TaxID=515499 RepID=A0A5D3KL36_9BRAD|nr:MurR/RpiR family transcriptional regulator [Bradyrhizobium rifense]TYL97837.1 MurR/RpiR family transcriptional regulator [Bradyrhizobium rifense]